MPDNPATQHKRKALDYLVDAGQATDLDTRQELLGLCAQELAKAVEHRGHAKEITHWPNRPDRRKKPR